MWNVYLRKKKTIGNWFWEEYDYLEFMSVGMN